MPIHCRDFAAHPTSYVTPSRPPMPARHCGPNTCAQAPDGTWWQVGCPEGPPRTVCQWKVDQDDPGQQQGAAYKKLEHHPDPAAAAAAGPDPAAAAAGPAAGRAGAGDGGVIHLGVGKQKVVDMSDADSFADVPPAVPPVATAVCRPLARECNSAAHRPRSSLLTVSRPARRSTFSLLTRNVLRNKIQDLSNHCPEGLLIAVEVNATTRHRYTRRCEVKITLTDEDHMDMSH